MYLFSLREDVQERTVDKYSSG